MTLKVLHSHYFGDAYPREWSAITQTFRNDQLITDPSTTGSGYTVLPHYRTVPFGDLLEAEIQQQGSHLINSFKQSARVRDLFTWVPLLADMTAPAYRIDQADDIPEGKYFVKGQTSSPKNRGAASVFADSKADALILAQRIADDSWFAGETPAIRPLQDYRRLGTTRKGLPIFNERRVFTYKGRILADGFYWDAFRQYMTAPIPKVDDDYWDAVNQACRKVETVADFLVIDLAQYTDGRWGVVELNDGCQAGVGGGVETDLYTNLHACF